MFGAFIIALSLVAGQTAPTPHRLDVTQLTAQDEMTVELDSAGCYHHERYEFQFRFRPSGAEVCVARWDQKKKAYTFLHERELTKKHLIRIQNLLAHMRQPSTKGCTTTDRVRFDVVRKGRPFASERYVDTTCAGSTDPKLFAWGDLI